MLFLVFKYAATAAVVVVVSELAKRSDRIGALVAALPIVTVMVMIWLYVEKQGTDKVANHAWYTFWYVLPTLPMFLLVPRLLRNGVNFWLALFAGIAMTAVLFAVLGVALRRFGIDIGPS